MAEITELKEKVRKAVTETRAAVKKIKTFETGIKTKNGKVVIRIPGRGLVAVAVPKGDLYFKDGAVKDSGVTNHKNAKWYKFTEPLHIKVGGNNTKLDSTNKVTWYKFDDDWIQAGSGSGSRVDPKGEWYNFADDPLWIQAGGSGSRVDPKGDWWKGVYDPENPPTYDKIGSGTSGKTEWYKFTKPEHIKVTPSGSTTGSTGKTEWYKFTEPEHIKVKANDSIQELAICGYLSKKDYLFLARRGCVIKDGIVNVPTEKVAEIKKYLKI